MWVHERTNARELAPEHVAQLDGPVDLVVIDVAFISLRLLLPPVAAVAPHARVIALVKPQFEVGRDRVGKGGVVRNDAERRAAAEQVAGSAARLGYAVLGQVDSRLAGPKGNREIFLHLARSGADSASESAGSGRG